ncbi:hypothetical protein AS156_30555 [Bradyrhizobium macuxiense]|uniref:Uncharacterized protein n=1 Tax=Bradyrhizobium macuxiense TaxID=1755647 RepID=A0A109K2Q0_9BRAD|nr:hypothetical protein [Bradyrhizobium macuxiense]KWV51980.1 hypothetical protein AS156_11195 [Bradyrhizobium macuxiense]KWV59724.1 hypothetical protein AS156_30555 [Bradyrhizobium macuxiense]
MKATGVFIASGEGLFGGVEATDVMLTTVVPYVSAIFAESVIEADANISASIVALTTLTVTHVL